MSFFLSNFCSGVLLAQQGKLKREDFLKEFVFKGNHLLFDFSALSGKKARIKKQSGDHPVSSDGSLGLLLSFKYSINFNNTYSLITGAEAMLLGRNIVTSFDKDDFNPALIKDYSLTGKETYYADMVLSLPVMLQRRWLYAGKQYLFADIGFRINFSTGSDVDSYSVYLQNVNNGYYEAAGVNVVANNDAKPWVSFPVNIGHAWLLRNNNVLQLAVCSNISFTKYVNGNYYIDIPGRPLTTGSYSSSGSYIGLSMHYVFTNANYRIRKAYERK